MKLVILIFSLMAAILIGVALLPGAPGVAYSEQRVTTTAVVGTPFPTLTPQPADYVYPSPLPALPPYPAPASGSSPIFRLLLPLARS